jgi:hypothetical protein
MSEQPEYYPVNDGKYEITAQFVNVDGVLEGWVRAAHADDEEAQARIAEFATMYANAGADEIRLRFTHRLQLSTYSVDDLVRCDGVVAKWDVEQGGWSVTGIGDDCTPILTGAMLDTNVPVFETETCPSCGNSTARRVSEAWEPFV